MQKTTNYDQFTFFDENREIIPRLVKKLVKSISSKNRLENYQILVDSKNRVIDGQHRLEAARKLGVPIYFEVMKDADLEDMRLLNDNSRGWSVNDFMHHYCKQDKDQYIVLRDYIKKYDFPTMLAARVLATRVLNGVLTAETVDEKLEDMFREGRYRMGDMAHAKKVGELAKKLKPSMDRWCYRRSSTINALSKICANDLVDTDKLVEKINYRRSKGNKIERTTNIREMLAQLETLYNKGVSGDSRVRFY